MKRKSENDDNDVEESSSEPPAKKVKNKNWSVSMTKLKTPGEIIDAVNGSVTTFTKQGNVSRTGLRLEI